MYLIMIRYLGADLGYDGYLKRGAIPKGFMSIHFDDIPDGVSDWRSASNYLQQLDEAFWDDNLLTMGLHLDPLPEGKTCFETYLAWNGELPTSWYFVFDDEGEEIMAEAKQAGARSYETSVKEIKKSLFDEEERWAMEN